MSEAIQLFKFEDQAVRTVLINNDPYFVGKDVATILGYSNSRKALSDHVDEEDKKVLTSQNVTLESMPNRGLAFINESGVYSLIFSSKMPKAKEFKHWVTSEVLPAIRKTGSYQIPQTPEEKLDLTMQVVQRTKKRLDTLENDVDFLKNKQEIDSEQRLTLEKTRKKKCIEVCGGKNSEFYRSHKSRKVFARLEHDLKDVFCVPTYASLKKDQYQEALDFIKNWYPDAVLKREIMEVNSQLSFLD